MMNKDDCNSKFLGLTGDELATVTGGASKVDFGAIRAKAESYCPDTAAKYAGLDPATVTRSRAQKMGNECLAEMGSFSAAFARGPIQRAIDTAFPK